MRRLFLKLKSCAILLLLKDAQQSWYPSKLARSSGTSYVHTVNLLSELRKNGAVASEKKGKQNVFHLTEKGAVLAQVLDDFTKKCDAFVQESRQQDASAAGQQQPSSDAAQRQEKQPAPDKRQ